MRRWARSSRASERTMPDVVPHQPADLVPGVADDDRLVGQAGLAGVPGGDVGRPARPGRRARRRRRGRRRPAPPAASWRPGGRRRAARSSTPRRWRRGCARWCGPRSSTSHAPAAVVRGGHHRDRLAAHVDAQLEAAPVDVGEALGQEVGRQVGHVEQRRESSPVRFISASMARATMSRGARSLQLVVAGHEGDAVAQPQDAALAAQGLADQERLGLGVVEAGGVELEELHVGHLGAHPVGHGHPVAGGDVGVGGVEVDLARAAGGDAPPPGPRWSSPRRSSGRTRRRRTRRWGRRIWRWSAGRWPGDRAAA